MNLFIRVSVPMSAVGTGDVTVTITEADIRQALQDICEINYPGCNKDCPVALAHGGPALLIKKGATPRCKCKDDGAKMLEFLRKKYERGMIL